MSEIRTADLCDHHDASLQVAEPRFRDYGGVTAFFGPIATVKVFEDNVLIRKILSEPGGGRVLVVDGAGSTRTALLGDKLADLGLVNGWTGVVINGCVRDSVELKKLAIGIKAIATMPRKSEKRGTGETGVVLHFAGARFEPGAFLYADADGIVLSPTALAVE